MPVKIIKKENTHTDGKVTIITKNKGTTRENKTLPDYMKRIKGRSK